MKTICNAAVVVLFAMFLCASLAIGQTTTDANPVPNPETTEVSKPSQSKFCPSECTVVKAIDNAGLLAAVGATLAPNQFVESNGVVLEDVIPINPLQFTKLYEVNGHRVTSKTRVLRGSVFFFLNKDLESPPDLEAVGKFFAAAQKPAKPEQASDNTNHPFVGPKAPENPTVPPATGAAATGQTTPSAPATPPAAEGSSAENEEVTVDCSAASFAGFCKDHGIKGKVTVTCSIAEPGEFCLQANAILNGTPYVPKKAEETKSPLIHDSIVVLIAVLLTIILQNSKTIYIGFKPYCHNIKLSIKRRWFILTRHPDYCVTEASSNGPSAGNTDPDIHIKEIKGVTPIDKGKPAASTTSTAQSTNLYVPLRKMTQDTRTWNLPAIVFNRPATATSADDFDWTVFGSVLRKRIRNIVGISAGDFWLEVDLNSHPNFDKANQVQLIACKRRFEDQLFIALDGFLNQFSENLAYAFLGYGTLDGEAYVVYRVGPRDINNDWPAALQAPVQTVAPTIGGAVQTAAAVS
jgi:hypothetical protein